MGYARVGGFCAIRYSGLVAVNFTRGQRRVEVGGEGSGDGAGGGWK